VATFSAIAIAREATAATHFATQSGQVPSVLGTVCPRWLDAVS
jgi:hypothetical protein